MRRVIAPIYLGTRRHPTARRIAAELGRWPALLGLRYSRLLADVQTRFRVSPTTAAVAVRLFRQQVGA